jgi:hypothetical protein
VVPDIPWKGKLMVVKLLKDVEWQAYKMVPRGILNLEGLIPLKGFIDEWTLYSSMNATLLVLPTMQQLF